jgi:hypothetical protein
VTTSVTYDIKASLSLWSVQGRTNLGLISFKRDFDSSEAFTVQVGNASIHTVKITDNYTN